MVVVETAAEVFVVEVAARLEERMVAASVAVLTVVSVVAVFVAVGLTLLTLKTKSLEPGKRDQRISNIISSSFVYHILTNLMHCDRRRNEW
jgi:hypothetical protein